METRSNKWTATRIILAMFSFGISFLLVQAGFLGSDFLNAQQSKWAFIILCFSFPWFLIEWYLSSVHDRNNGA